MVTKLKAYGAAVGAAATALVAVLAPDTPLVHILTGVVAILVGLGVYQLPYRVPPKD